LIKRLIFDQFFRESKKNLKKLHKYPYKSELKRKRKGIKKREDMGKYSIDRSYCEDSKA
jgi:hypothetical protein